MDTTTVTRRDLNEIKRMIRERKPEPAPIEWINEDQVCQLLDISKRTLRNYLSNGRITRDMYREAVNGAKFFNRDKIMGS